MHSEFRIVLHCSPLLVIALRHAETILGQGGKQDQKGTEYHR